MRQKEFTSPSDLVAKLTGALRKHSPATNSTEPNLSAALTDAIEQPGRLVRAQLVFLGCCAQKLREPDALALAAAVEYFHLASLLYDDLPCMDDSRSRRGRPCLHRVYGEATTILAALALVNRAYALIHDVLSTQPRGIRTAANACVEKVLGAGGILGGQARDLRYSEHPPSAREVLQIAVKKTSMLFQLAVYFPAIFGSPGPHERRALRGLCVYWGLMYQITDDLNDVLSTNIATGKTTGRDQSLNRPNLALATSVPQARNQLMRLLALADRTVQLLGQNSRWLHLVTFHHTYFSEFTRQKALLGARSAA